MVEAPVTDRYPPDYCPCGGSTTTGCDPSTFCWCHNAHEPDDGAYRACFECGHVYPLASDLEAAYEEVVRSMDPTAVPRKLRADDIGFCQYCLHDW